MEKDPKTRDLKKNKKPIADNLERHPKLKKLLSKVKDQPHPIDTVNWFRVLTLSYVKPYIALTKKMIVTQNCHFDLPKEDHIIRASNKLASKIYNFNFKNLKDPDKEIGFDIRQNSKFSLLGSLIKSYKFVFFYITFFSLLIGGLSFYVVYGTKEVLTEISDQISEKGKIYNKEVILKWFLIIWAIGLISSILTNWINVQQYRLIFRLIGPIYSFIYLKILKIGIINSHEHDEGSIINYLQSDIEQILMFALAISAVSIGFLNLILSITLGIVYFRLVFLTLLAGLVILGLINAVLMTYIMVLRKKKQEKTDKRINALKNVLKNFRFVKINALENIFMKSINIARDNELKTNLLLRLCWVGLNFIFVFGTPAVIVTFLYFYFESGGTLDIASVTILIRIFSLLQDSLFLLPGSLMLWVNMQVSVKRISLFLNSKELEYNRVREKEDLKDEEAISVKNGYFYWDKKKSKEEAEDDRKAKLKEDKENKRRIKKEKKKKKKGEIRYESDTSSLRQTLLSQVTQSTNEKMNETSETKFQLKDINFIAKKGKLTTIIGKTGSGKSTLLYSILGETMIKDFSSTKVKVNGRVCYSGQNPWLMNATVKENIILNKEYNEKKFKWALKFSALDEDLIGWDKRENHEIGESGAALSGGQKARVALARCLYQE